MSNRKEAKPLPEAVERLHNKSEKIRALRDLGWTRGDVSRALGISYQHVNNVWFYTLKRKVKEERDWKRAEAERARAEAEQEKGET